MRHGVVPLTRHLAGDPRIVDLNASHGSGEDVARTPAPRFDVIGKQRAKVATIEPCGAYAVELEAHSISSAAPKSAVFCGVAGVCVLRFVMEIK